MPTVLAVAVFAGLAAAPLVAVAAILQLLKIPWCSGFFLEDRTMWKCRHHPAVTEAELVHNMMLLYPNIVLHTDVIDNATYIGALGRYSIPIRLRHKYPILCNILHDLHKYRDPDCASLFHCVKAIKRARKHYKQLYAQYQKSLCGATHLGALCADLQDTISLNMAQFIKGPPAKIEVLGQIHMHGMFPASVITWDSCTIITYSYPSGRLEFRPDYCKYTTFDESSQMIIIKHYYDKMSSADRATFANYKMAGHNLLKFVNKHAD